MIDTIDKYRDIHHSTVRSFADDKRVMKAIKSDIDCPRLQEDLAKIYEWSVSNNMKFNGDKFELVRYTVSGDPVPFQYETQDGTEIAKKHNVTDIGVVLSDSATFINQVGEVTARARQRMGWILRVFTTRDRSPMLTLYKALVLPLLEYCCQLW